MGYHYRGNNSKLANVAVVVAVFLLMSVMIGSKCIDSESTATQEAENWARRMFPGKQAIVDCQGYDTDANGYVSCTISVDGRVQGIECASNWSLNNGCRIPILNLRNNQ
jgi:hypothetical protein